MPGLLSPETLDSKRPTDSLAPPPPDAAAPPSACHGRSTGPARRLSPVGHADKDVAEKLKMPPLGSWSLQVAPCMPKSARARQLELYCPTYPKITAGAGPLWTLVLNPHVDGVARFWTSKLVLHRQTHASQCIAHLLLVLQEMLL